MPTTQTRSSVQFNPPNEYKASQTVDPRGDTRTGEIYVFNDRIRLAVQVALATARPLLVRGDSGWGKSSLAAATAHYLGWRFHETVITSRTQARDLQWNIDLLMRLNDAQANRLKPDWGRYICPSVLWWALDPKGAAAQERLYDESCGAVPDVLPTPAKEMRAVILLDEIDKADPDVPNNLLVTLGSLEFEVEETKQKVRADKASAPLVFITTNEERELPTAFLRRCVELRLPALGDDKDGSLRRSLLVDIALQHTGLERKYVERVATTLMPPPTANEPVTAPSPAEFKDTVLALVDRWGSTDPSETQMKEIAEITFTKRGPRG
jgi:MoxR-like ATPase